MNQDQGSALFDSPNPHEETRSLGLTLTVRPSGEVSVLMSHIDPSTRRMVFEHQGCYQTGFTRFTAGHELILEAAGFVFAQHDKPW